MKKTLVLTFLLLLVSFGVVCAYAFRIPRSLAVVHTKVTDQIHLEARALAAAGEPARAVFNEETGEAEVIFRVPGGEQRMPLTESAIAYLRGGGTDVFVITFADVNFDSKKDVGVLTSMGYGGVNLFYTYYVFNKKSGQYEEVTALGEIPMSPEIDLQSRTITTRMKSGQTWVEDRIVLEGEQYVHNTKELIRDWE